MAGGRSSYFKSDLDDLKQKLRASDESTENSEYEADVASLLSSQLTDFNDRDDEAIDKHLKEIKGALEKELEDTIDLMFGGSVAKKTYVEGLSDIDSLVILDNCELAEGTPDEAKEYFARRLKERFPRTEVKEGVLAVTVCFSDAEIQLLPAISCERNVKIADSSGHRWSEINPRGFTEVLRETDRKTGKKVVPVIKLAKGIIGNLPEKHKISGYHAESLAVEIFKNYKGDLSPKAMLKHYFHEASRRVQQPIRDRTGQSIHVDDYLGAPNSLGRKIVSDAFDRVSRRMNNADSAGSIEELPFCLKWTVEHEDTLSRKSRLLASNLSEAFGQIPVGEAGFVYLAYEETRRALIADHRTQRYLDMITKWEVRKRGINPQLIVLNRLYPSTIHEGRPNLIESAIPTGFTEENVWAGKMPMKVFVGDAI